MFDFSIGIRYLNNLFIYAFIPLIVVVYGIYLLVDKEFMDVIRERDKFLIIGILVVNLIILMD